MSQKNVIITSGSTNQIIRLPVVSSTTRSATPIEIVTSASGSLTINRTNGQNLTIRPTPERNSNYFSPQSRQSSGQNSPFNRSGSSNREIFGNNEGINCLELIKINILCNN